MFPKHRRIEPGVHAFWDKGCESGFPSTVIAGSWLESHKAILSRSDVVADADQLGYTRCREREGASRDLCRSVYDMCNGTRGQA